MREEMLEGAPGMLHTEHWRMHDPMAAMPMDPALLEP